MAISMSVTSRLFHRKVRQRLSFFLTIFCVLTGLALLYSRVPRDATPVPISRPNKPKPSVLAHPIDTLMKKADREWHRLMAKETTDLESAAMSYRWRRGRHPPPGFDKWVEFARAHDAVIVEDFFDQIYHDLTPFWGVEAAKIRRQAKNFDFVISVRDGNATFKSDDRDRPWMILWHNLTATVAEWLPDIDVPINVMDESRVVVPWEDINEYVKAERATRRVVPRPEVVTEYSGLKELDEDPGEPFDPEWIKGGIYWDTARVGCPPDSPSRNVEAVVSLN